MIFGIFARKIMGIFAFFLVRAKRPCYNQSINIYTEKIRFSVRRLDLTEGGTQVRTIETGKAIVDIVAWPENRPWEGRYQTSSQIERGLCRLVLSPDVFHDAARANTAYRRFARKIEREGLVPPNIVFRHMVSRTSQNVFCILTTTESVFNSACSVGKFYVVESGIDERRRLCAVRVRDQAAPNNPQENVM